MNPDKKILLISMPYGAMERPALGISLLKSALSGEGIPCDLEYLNFRFAEFIGAEEYRWISLELPYIAFAGDWTFTRWLYGARHVEEERFCREILRDTWRLGDQDIQRITRIRDMAGHFLDHCMAATPWEEYAVVGFTSTFEQNISSLSLAKRIKAAFPEIHIVFGGANWEGEMGLELHRRFPFVDYACSGEADQSLPELIRRLMSGKSVAEAPAIKGIIHRMGGGSTSTGPAAPVMDLDQLPLPDFSDFFSGLDQCAAATGTVPVLLIETSRGCWWGAKSHCMFCGLNGERIGYRSKSSGRVRKELQYLLDMWQVEMVQAVDNILNMSFFRELLPELARQRLPVQIFYEVKSNLTREQLELMRAAGITRIQAGIESLSDHVLALMRKGCNALQNIQMLKWCRELDIAVDWNIIYGFPGETADDYEKMFALLDAIRFLGAPDGCGPVRLDRFSPFFADPDKNGFRRVRPLPACHFIYPFPEESVSRIASSFDYDYKPETDPSGFMHSIMQYVDDWRQNPESGALRAVSRPDGALMLLDTRAGAAAPQQLLNGLERDVYLFYNKVRSVREGMENLSANLDGQTDTGVAIRDILDRLVAGKTMVTDGTNYLSLALSTPQVTAATADEQIVSRQG